MNVQIAQAMELDTSDSEKLKNMVSVQLASSHEGQPLDDIKCIMPDFEKLSWSHTMKVNRFLVTYEFKVCFHFAYDSEVRRYLVKRFLMGRVTGDFTALNHQLSKTEEAIIS